MHPGEPLVQAADTNSKQHMAIDLFLVASALLCFLLHLALRHFLIRPASTLPLPPGPRGIPVLGALPLVGSTPHSSLARLARRYGPIMYLKMGTCGAVVASSPSAARTFLKAFDAQFANRPPAISAKEVTYGYQNMVFANYGPKWKLLRKLSSLHLLGAKALADWAPVRRAEAAHMLRGMLDAARRVQPVTLPDVLVCAFANIISQITLSLRIFDAQGEESNQYKDMIVELLTGGDLFNIGDFVPCIAWMDLQGVQAKLRRIHKRYDGMVTKLLEAHAASAKQREGKPDFLDVIMANREGEDGETITDVNIKALVFVCPPPQFALSLTPPISFVGVIPFATSTIRSHRAQLSKHSALFIHLQCVGLKATQDLMSNYCLDQVHWTTLNPTVDDTPHYPLYFTNSRLRVIHRAYAPRCTPSTWTWSMQ